MHDPKDSGDPFAPDLLARLSQPPRKVAVLRASRVGDFICATPAFRALRCALPQAEISIITLPMLRDLALRSPHVDRYIAFPGFPGIAEQFFEPRRATRFFARMQAEGFDLAIQLQGSGVNANPFTLLFGAGATAGFVRPGDPPGRLDAALPYPQEGHEVRRALALAEFLGAPARGEEVEFPLRPEDHAAAGRLLAEAEPPLIGLHPGARDATRRWAHERFAAVALELQRRHGGTVVLLGADETRQGVARVLRAARRLGLGAYLDLSDGTSLPALGAVIARLALLVTNDSGPAHVAYALGTPAVTIFGGANPVAYGPPQSGPYRAVVHEVRCRPRGPVSCSGCDVGLRCLEGVTVSQVLVAAEAVFPRAAPTPTTEHPGASAHAPAR